MTDRHGPHHPPEEIDRFTRWGEDASGVLEEHWRKLVAGLVLVLVLGVAWSLYERHRHQEEMAAQAQVARIADQFPGDGVATVPESSIRAAVSRYETFLEGAPEGSARWTAQLYLAQAYDAVGEVNRAREAYEALHSAPAVFAGPARMRLAYLAVAEGDLKAAGMAFDQVMASDPGLAPQAALELGYLAEHAGESEAAIASYRTVTERFPTSPQAAEAKARLQALGVEPEPKPVPEGAAPEGTVTQEPPAEGTPAEATPPENTPETAGSP